MVIATDYKYMKNLGQPPRFEEAFAFKHILNAVDSDTSFLKVTRPLDKNGVRIEPTTALQTNTDRAYAQAMNRFNTAGVSTMHETILEGAVDPPRPHSVDAIGGIRSYHFNVERGWKFERVENNFAAPNFTKYEAMLRSQFYQPRVANMSCKGAPGVVNHWDQGINQAWFG